MQLLNSLPDLTSSRGPGYASHFSASPHPPPPPAAHTAGPALAASVEEFNSFIKGAITP